MKQILIITGASLAALILSIVGTFMLVPVLLPEKDAEPDQVTRAASPDSPGDTDDWARRTLHDIGIDSLQVLQQAALKTRDYSLDSLEALVIRAQAAIVLKDSLDEMQEILASIQTRNERLEKDLEIARNESQATSGRTEAANALSATLTRLEERELRAILSEMDASVIRQLYAQAPDNRKSTILRALPPAEAARLVEGFVAPGTARRRDVPPRETDAEAVTARLDEERR